LNRWVRVTLVGIAVFLVAVFTVAVLLNPYNDDGTARRMATHTELGLPQCTFYQITGLPCPSCGMTTSFSLLVRGDLVNSLRANCVGTLLAVVCLVLIPWNLACAFRGRWYFIRSLERSITLGLAIFLALMLLRWGLVLAFGW
jgi:hypothetical protein